MPEALVARPIRWWGWLLGLLVSLACWAAIGWFVGLW